MPDDLVALSDAGYIALFREIVLRSGGEVLEEDGLMLFASAQFGEPLIVNGVMRLDRSVSAQETIDRAREYAARRGRTAGISTNGQDGDLVEALEGGGWELLVTLPGMIAVDPIATVEPGPGIVMAPVEDAAALRTLIEVLGESFGPEEPWPGLWADVFNDISTVNAPDISAILAFADGQPAAAGVAYALDPVGVVGMVGAKVGFGGRGLGDLVTRHVAAETQRLTRRPVVLQSSPKARPLYERVGFQVVTTYRLWVDSAQLG